MIKQLLFFALLLFSSLAFAQNDSLKSKIKFKDGSGLYAKIKENVPTHYVVILLSDNESFRINYEDILSVKHKDFVYYSKYIQPKGFYIEGVSSILVGKETEISNLRIGISMGGSVNYRFNSYLSAGVGVEPTAFINNKNTPMPIYVHLKSNLMERRTVPVFVFDIGWAIVSNKNNNSDFFRTQGGWFARPAIGLQTSKVTFSIGYHIQKKTTVQENNGWWWRVSNQITTEERLMRNVSIITSFKF